VHNYFFLYISRSLVTDEILIFLEHTRARDDITPPIFMPRVSGLRARTELGDDDDDDDGEDVLVPVVDPT